MSNQEFNFLYILLLIGFGFLFLLILVLYFYANHAIKESEKEINKYKKQLSEVRRNRDRIKHTTSRKWPIWPRPVLFEEIDQSTQLALASLERDSEVVEEIAQAIRSIDPLPNDIYKILGIKGNIWRLIFHYQNKRKLREFSRCYQDVVVAAQTIDGNRKRINALKRKVEKRIEQLAADYANTRTNISYFQRLGVKRYQDASENLQTVQNCIDWAEGETKRAKRDDMIEWPASDLLCQIGSVSLSIFSLKGQSYTFSENYEPDRILYELSGLTTDIKSALAKTDLYDWKSLVQLRSHIRHFSRVLEDSESLLVDFESNVQDFQNLIDQLKAINISNLHHDAQTLEDNLADYIGSPSDSSDIWKRSLGEQLLPSEAILIENTRFKETIQPMIQGTIIKQSKLHHINLTLQRFLENIQNIRNRIALIQELLTYHRKCESEVKDRLSDHGKTTLFVKKLDEFTSNSTQEIMKACQSKHRLYQKYKERAYGIKSKANFPGLLEDLQLLENECKQLFVEHSNLILRLQGQAQEQRRNLVRLINDFTDLRQKPPFVQLDWDQLIQELAEAEREYEHTANNYRHLDLFVRRSRELVREKTVVLKEAWRQHREYQRLYKEIEKQINSADKQISGTISKLRTSWNTPLAKHVQELASYQDQYANLSQQLESTQRGLMMDEASIICRIIKQRIDKLDRAVKRESDLGIEYKNALDRMQKEIEERFRNKNVTEAYPAVMEDARKDYQLARDANDPQKAIYHLNEAIKTLKKAHLYTAQGVQVADNRPILAIFGGDRVEGNKVERISNVRDGSKINIAGRNISQTRKSGGKRKKK